MKKSILAGVAASLLVGVLVIIIVTSYQSVQPVVTRAKLAAKEAVPAPPLPASPKLDRLQIQAIRDRTYLASTLSVTQDLGDQGGYHETISSFQSDGLTQYALVSTPNTVKPPGGWPVVILAHGYINPATYLAAGPNYASTISELARAGYLVVKPDYRGHGRSQGIAEGGHFSPVYTYDVLNLIATVKKYPVANPARIGLLGHSLGGHVALRTIVVSKDIKATVFMAGVVGSMHDLLYDWPQSPITRDQPAAVVQKVRAGVIGEYGTPETNPHFWESASAINFVADVTGPVQINQAVGDNVVPRLFSDHLAAALTAKHKSVQYYQYPGNDHQFSQNHSLLMQRILTFYAANL